MRERFINPNVVSAADMSSVISELVRDAGVADSFAPAALAEAEAARRDAPAMLARLDLPDRTDLPFVTIDPEGSRDLDQAVFFDGDVVYYAIAAVALFVRPGGALDAEVRQRATTIYLPDRSIPLHPEALSADAASLLAGQERPAYVWRFELERGHVVRTGLELARIRSRAQLTYQQVQAAYDGEALPVDVPSSLPQDLARVGRSRQRIEAERGGVSLNLPEQRVGQSEDGFQLEFRQPTAVEAWNSQISLMTGMEAARIMLDANLGILRTLPAAREADVARLRGVAGHLGLMWVEGQSYGDFMRGLDATNPSVLAFLYEAATLFRGADYLPLPDADTDTVHHAIAAPYAHVTAPLRRLVDRYGLEVCRCVLAGTEVPEWVRQALPDLPGLMSAGSRRANSLQSKAIAVVEGLTLRGREGEEFSGVVVEDKGSDGGCKRGLVAIDEPALETLAVGTRMPVGKRVRVRLVDVSDDLKPYFEVL